MSSNIIYNFNVGRDLDKIKFKTLSDNEFVITGISIIRRKNEVTVLLNTGRRIHENDSIHIDEIEYDTNNPNKKELLAKFSENIKKNKVEFEFIDDKKEFIKVLFACRIDLDTFTVDAQYIAEETNFMFQVITDEIDGFLNEEGEFVSAKYEETFKSNMLKVNEFNAILEVAKMSLFLPYYFNINEEAIIEENIETEFKKHYNTPIKKREFSNVFGHKYHLKTLYSILNENTLSPDVIKYRDDFFNIKTSGYWKKINLNEIGLDKKGNAIHGRTWVNQNLSWFHAKESELIIKKEKPIFKGNNAGFIYILRNPTMDENIFKIGLTRDNVEKRANQLSKTSVPDKFYKSQEWNVRDCVTSERQIHKLLNDYRVDPRREFFKIDYDIAIQVITQVVKETNEE